MKIRDLLADKKKRRFVGFAIGLGAQALLAVLVLGGVAAPDWTIHLAFAAMSTISDAAPLWFARAVQRAPTASRFAATGNEMRRRRQGGNPTTVKAAPAGRLPTNIVFSTTQGERKQFYARLNRSLRSGRVVILTDTAIGGVEGRLEFRPVLSMTTSTVSDRN